MNPNPHPAGQSLTPRLRENASVKLVGLGGVGGIVARYLTLFLASLSQNVRLFLIDGDSFEPANSGRMFFGGSGNKAVLTRDQLLPCTRETGLSLIAIEEYLQGENIARLIREGDIVILAVDNHATRKLVSDFCRQQLGDVCLISGGNDGLEELGQGKVRRGTYGNVQIYLREAGADLSPDLTRYHPEIANPADRLPTDRSCTELLVSVPQLLFTNLTVAAALLNTFWVFISGAVPYDELMFDIAEGRMRPTRLPLPQPTEPTRD